VLALGSPAFYYDVARHWGGIGLLYLLLLFTLTWIPTLVKMQIGFGTFVNEEFPKVAEAMPPITLKNGRVSSPVEQPYTITDPQTGKVMFVLDTTGKINTLEQTEALFLLTETRLHQRDERQGRIQIHDLRQFPDMTITKEKIQGWLATIGNWLGVGVFPFALIGSLIRALVLMLLAALLGLIANAVVGAGLGFGALMRLAAVGMTASVYLDTALGLAGVPVPFWFLIALALTTAYVAFGVKAAGPAMLPQAPAVEPDPWDIRR
jgi:hypothetical protein